MVNRSRKRCSACGRQRRFRKRFHAWTAAPRRDASVDLHREIALDELVKPAVGPQTCECAVEQRLDLRVRLGNRNGDAVAEELGFEVRAPLQFAAPFRGCAMQPEHEADAVVEDVVDLTLDERIAREIWVFEGADGAGAEEGAQERLVRRVLGNADAFALQRFRADVEILAITLAGKAAGVWK